MRLACAAERPNIDTRINPHYLVGTQVTFGKKDILDALFDETGAVGSLEIVGDTAPGNTIVCMYVCMCIIGLILCLK